MSVQFYGYDFEGTGVFHFFRFYAFFSKISFRSWWFWNLMCCRKKTLRTHYMQKSVNEWIEPFIANLGHPLWGSQSMQDLASLMRKSRTFQIPGAIPELTACPIKDDPDLQWMALFIHSHSFACNAFSVSFSYNT